MPATMASQMKIVRAPIFMSSFWSFLPFSGLRLDSDICQRWATLSSDMGGSNSRVAGRSAPDANHFLTLAAEPTGESGTGCYPCALPLTPALPLGEGESSLPLCRWLRPLANQRS